MENEIKINLKDILSIEGMSENLSKSIAEKIFEKNLYDNEQDEDTGEFYNILKPQIKEDLRNMCRDLIKEEASRILKDSYDVRNLLKDKLAIYINCLLEQKVDNIKNLDF